MRGSRQVTSAVGSCAAVRTAAAIFCGSSQETKPVQAIMAKRAKRASIVPFLACPADGGIVAGVKPLALALVLVLLAAARPPDAGSDPAAECARIDARIARRKRFLAIREKERLIYPTDPTFSPYCQGHPRDEDCALPGQDQAQEDLSRDVSELTVGPHGEPPETDPVLVPLQRRRRELACPRR